MTDLVRMALEISQAVPTVLLLLWWQNKRRKHDVLAAREEVYNECYRAVVDERLVAHDKNLNLIGDKSFDIRDDRPMSESYSMAVRDCEQAVLNVWRKNKSTKRVDDSTT